MAKKKRKPKLKPSHYDAMLADTPCIFCGSESRMAVEYECGYANHQHPVYAVCKICYRTLHGMTGGAFAAYRKRWEDPAALAQKRAEAVEAVEQMLRRQGGQDHSNGYNVN